ncbi:hypothetical protein Cantr_03390 [Candida viswanathii]|uniref:Endoplasmic reticulum membrane protein C16E8.02 n=1 Tax=Candida viswanathii TaxID=5486 RepID=A0A367YLH7_9ASCO|nr:hypothetical protein Cantr_03390 [Candida viswanathii]
MPGLFDLESHLVFYRSYHFNQTNVTIHLICIPIILLSTIAFLSPLHPLSSSPVFNLGTLLAWSYGAYYVLLDWKVGVPAASVLVSFAYYIGNVYRGLSDAGKDEFIKVAVGLHVLSWLAQFYGHGVHEKRAPALLDNLLQALVLAPYFVAFEIAFFLGYRKDLKKTMDNRAGVIVRDFIQQNKAKKAAT